MTEEQIILIKKSWRLLRNIDPQIVGDTFYSKLFADNRSLRKMFPTDMEQQYRKLIDMLSAIVMRLDNIDELTDNIAAMAQRHVQYGVKPLHYSLVGKALLWTLKQGLGKDWNKETAEAWSNCYTLLANAMIQATDKQNALH